MVLANENLLDKLDSLAFTGLYAFTTVYICEYFKLQIYKTIFVKLNKFLLYFSMQGNKS